MPHQPNSKPLIHHPSTNETHIVNDSPSFARWWRQVLFVPLLQSRWFSKAVQKRLTEKVAAAEVGHRGEVFLVVENHLPLHDAYYAGVRSRAIDLFSLYRVWDTEENTGVLVYVNICEHGLEIVADRGVSSHVSDTVWRAMCDKALAGMSNGKMEQSLADLLDEIGRVLRQHYYLTPDDSAPDDNNQNGADNDPQGNELADTVVFLK